jgi:gluconate 2-dehydrogenase gamma chain
MNPSDTAPDRASRRHFLLSSGSLVTSAWLIAQRPAIAAAAEHAAHAAELQAGPEPVGFEFLSSSEASDIEAIAAQIVPSGATPGAREAHTIHFIDRALASFFSGWASDYRAGLAAFQAAFRETDPSAASFAAATADQQLSFVQANDRSTFFENTRLLTVLGMFALPKYGGNYQGNGWKLLGFEDQHIFSPPFGDYDRDYTGFVPYTTGPST